MKRKILIVVLALGTIGGFASGFMSLGPPRAASAVPADAPPN